MTSSIRTNVCKGKPSEVDKLEHVEVYVKLSAPRRGDVNMILISPAGTRYIS